jgi:adenylate cyclase
MENQLHPQFVVKPGRFGLLMSDLRGFTALTGQYPVDKLAPLLNHYFQRMTELIGKHGGTVDKFMGDSIFALFPLDQPQDAALAMMSCAVDMQVAMDEINRYSASLALPDIYMGIGLNVGDVVTCTLGSGIYKEQTVLGDPVNLVARMAAFALRGQVLISSDLLESMGDKTQCGASFQVMLKGRKYAITVHELIGITYPVAKSIPARENRKGPRVDVMLPISYHKIEDQQVHKGSIRADIIDLSYGGMRIMTPQSHNLLDEIKIVVPFGSDKGDVYAKVLSCTQESGSDFCISTEFSYLDEFTRKSIRSLVDHLA